MTWAAAEGWNPGLHDAGCFHAADRDGFLVGLLGTVPVATVSVVRYGATFGFLGLYIVQPAYRGLGYGMRIWTAGLAYLAGRNIGLDGVVAQQDNYRKSGFTFAYRNIRYRGTATGVTSIAAGSCRCRRCRSRIRSRTTAHSSPTSAARSCAAGSRSRKAPRSASCAEARWPDTV